MLSSVCLISIPKDLVPFRYLSICSTCKFVKCKVFATYSSSQISCLYEKLDLLALSLLDWWPPIGTIGVATGFDSDMILHIGLIYLWPTKFIRALWCAPGVIFIDHVIFWIIVLNNSSYKICFVKYADHIWMQKCRLERGLFFTNVRRCASRNRK